VGFGCALTGGEFLGEVSPYGFPNAPVFIYSAELLRIGIEICQLVTPVHGQQLLRQ
jgi:hypothetical protein